MAVELAVRRLRPERKQEVGEAPVGAALPCRAEGAVLRAPGNVGDAVLRRADVDRVIQRLVLAQLVDIDMAAVQIAEMRRVDLALDRLQVIAIALDHADVDLGVGRVEDLQRGQGRRLGPCAHIDPDEAGAFDRRIRLRLHLVPELLLRCHVGHVETVAGDVELPAVIDAAPAASA